jgi:hypothetical protein
LAVLEGCRFVEKRVLKRPVKRGGSESFTVLTLSSPKASGHTAVRTARDIERTLGTVKAQAALMISQSPSRLFTKAKR